MKTRNTKLKMEKVQEAVWNVLSEKEEHTMLYSDLVEIVNNMFQYSITGKSVAMYLRKQVREQKLVRVIARDEGFPMTYYQLHCDNLETFLK